MLENIQCSASLSKRRSWWKFGVEVGESWVEGRDYIYIFFFFFQESIRDERRFFLTLVVVEEHVNGGRFDGMGGSTRFVNQMILREAASMARGTKRERERGRERERDSNKFNFCSRLVGLLQASLTFVSRPLRRPLSPPSFAVS